MVKDFSSKILKELAALKKSKGIYVLVVSPENYNAVMDSTMKVLTVTFNLTGIYVTVNKNYDVMGDRFKKVKVKSGNLLVIDASGEKNKKEVDNCFVTKSKSLTEISLAISEAVHTGKFKFVLFDSISTLLVYHPLNSVQKFSQFIVSKMRNMGVDCILITLNDAESQKVLPVISQFCDKVIVIQ